MNTNSIWALIALSTAACGSTIATPQSAVIDPFIDAGVDSLVEVSEVGTSDTTSEAIADSGSVDGLGADTSVDGNGGCGAPWEGLTTTCTDRETNGWCEGALKSLWSNCCSPPLPGCSPFIAGKNEQLAGAWCCSY